MIRKTYYKDIFFFIELSQTFNQIQIGRIRGEEKQVDIQYFCFIHHFDAPLITGIVPGQ